jgi:hypothetical protein
MQRGEGRKRSWPEKCGHALKDVTPRGPKGSTQLSVCHHLGHMKNRYWIRTHIIQITQKSFLLLLIRCHHIYHGLHHQELSHLVPKVEKGRVEHTFRFRKVRRGELGSQDLGEGEPGILAREGGSAAEEMVQREKLVCLAKLAEQAERYDGEGSRSCASA